MSEIVLFDRKSGCCGCGACANACPKGAISMRTDELGFAYPQIDPEKCVRCGICMKVCSFGKANSREGALAGYAAQVRSEETLKVSTSGGVFASLASAVIAAGGAAFGCTGEKTKDGFHFHHIMAETQEELRKLQGSKYVQSSTEDVYRQVKKLLDGGRTVLFSGTPCQVAGLRGFLRGREYPNLFAVDIICHGVPSEAFFNDYARFMGKKLGGEVEQILFRDKSVAWSHRGSVRWHNGNGREKKKVLYPYLSSYYGLFLGCDSLRDSCYECPYSAGERPGDLTLGDFWGFEKEHPDYLKQNGGELDAAKGVSCILVNTPRGEELLEQFGSGLKLKESEYSKIIRGNDQLREHAHRGPRREKMAQVYCNQGYAAVDRWYFKQMGFKKYKLIIRYAMPKRLKKLISKAKG